MPDKKQFKKNFGDFMQHYVDYVRKIVSDPGGFFLRKSEEKGYLEPTIFALVSILLPELFYGLLIAPPTFGLSLVMMVPNTVYNYCILFIAAILVFGLIRLCRGRGDFESVYRSVAYSSVASLLLFLPLPFFNFLLFALLFGFLLYFALRDVHHLSQHQALLVLLVPVLFILTVGIIRLALFFICAIKLYFILQNWMMS